MWTLKDLQAVAERRGELNALNGNGAEALLAHERSKGRTEEKFAREEAKQELDKLLAAGGVVLPDARDGEYDGLQELRKAVAEFEREQAAVKDAENEKADGTFIERAWAKRRARGKSLSR